MNAAASIKTIRLLPPSQQPGFEGINRPMLGHDENGREVLFKRNKFQGATGTNEDGNSVEIISSRLFADELGLPGVVVEEAQTTEGEAGVCSEFLPNRQSLARAGLSQVNPEQLAPQIVARDFLGDWDSGPRNYLVSSTGFVQACDFGSTPHKGLPAQEGQGLIEQTLAKFHSEFGLEKLTQPIAQLSDQDIQKMVHRAASHLSRPRPDLEKFFVEALTHNRDIFRYHNPYPMAIHTVSKH